MKALACSWGLAYTFRFHLLGPPLRRGEGSKKKTEMDQKKNRSFLAGSKKKKRNRINKKTGADCGFNLSKMSIPLSVFFLIPVQTGRLQRGSGWALWTHGPLGPALGPWPWAPMAQPGGAGLGLGPGPRCDPEKLHDPIP